MVLTAGFILAAAIWKVVRRSKSDYWLLLLISSVAGSFSLIYGTLINYAPSYNQFLLLFSSMAFFIAVSQASGLSPRRNALQSLTFVVCMAIVLVCKPTVFLPLILLCAFVRSSQPQKIFSLLARETIFAMLSVVLAFLAYKLYLRDFLDVSQIETGLRVLRDLQQAHPLQVIAINFFESVIQVVVACGFLVLLFFMTRMKILNRPFAQNSNLLLAFIALSIGGLFWLGGSDRWKSQSIYLHLSIILLFLLVIFKSPARLKNPHALLGLCCFPYVLSIGTNNLYFSQTLFYCSAWGVVVGFLVYFSASIEKSLKVIPSIAVVLILVIFCQQLTYLARNSYGTLQPLYKNSMKIYIQGLGSLLVDSQTYESSQSSVSAIRSCKIRPLDVLIATQGLSGLNLLMNMRPSGAAWIYDLQTLKYISRVEILHRPRHVVWAFRLEDSILRQDFMNYFTGLKFIKCGQFAVGEQSTVQLWRLE